MVYIDDVTKDKIKKINLNSVYFIVNFNNVITDENSCDTWNTITDNITSGKKITKKIEDSNCKCREIESDSSIEFDEKCECLKNIWKENISLLKETKIDDKKIMRIINNKKSLRIRCGVKKFFKVANEKGIPIIIICDGVKEVIKCLLECNKCYYDNIYIISNSILSSDESDLDKIIHPLNRNELSIPDEIKSKIKNRRISILLASSINDINMLSKTGLKDSVKIAFLDKDINENFDMFLNYFNVIYTHNTPFDRLANTLKCL